MYVYVERISAYFAVSFEKSGLTDRQTDTQTHADAQPTFSACTLRQNYIILNDDDDILLTGYYYS